MGFSLAALSAGATEVYLIEQAMAAAIGAGSISRTDSRRASRFMRFWRTTESRS